MISQLQYQPDQIVKEWSERLLQGRRRADIAYITSHRENMVNADPTLVNSAPRLTLRSKNMMHVF